MIDTFSNIVTLNTAYSGQLLGKHCIFTFGSVPLPHRITGTDLDYKYLYSFWIAIKAELQLASTLLRDL